MAGPKARTSIILLAVAIGLAALVAGRVLLVGPDELSDKTLTKQTTMAAKTRA